jgi:ATP-dependent metalloprotease FtsH
MELNTAMQFVITRAQAETIVLGNKNIYPEHVFLGILKLAELRGEDIAKRPDDREQTDEDIRHVAALFRKEGINTRETRQNLRKILRSETPSGDGEAAIADLLLLAAHAEGKRISAKAILNVLLGKPTPMMEVVLDRVAPAKVAQRSPQKVRPAAGKPEEAGAFLPELTRRIRTMRYALLEKVHGQDHVVHAFAEGMFASEVLAAADEKRRSPRAIFVFAGPPGVGKTFLAEQAAEALSIPCKRFDMSSFADHQAQINLIGFAPSYKEAKPGLLTGFVKENPHSILIFDEIEKAHLNTILLFLQILDAGTLHDDFEDENIAFKDTIIIFTTNAGRQLYEGEPKPNVSGLPRQTLLNALETDTHPQTGMPFFPGPICSRLATGYPMMFNHLQAHDLERISAGEFKRLSALFEKQYGIRTEVCEQLPALLLFAEGGQADARTLKAQTEWFFKNELFRLCRLWDSSLETALEKLESIRFEIDASSLAAEVKVLFENPSHPEILFFGSASQAKQLKAQLPHILIHDTHEEEEAVRIVSEHPVSLVLMELSGGSSTSAGLTETRKFWNGVLLNQDTRYAFDYVPATATFLRASRSFFKTLRQCLPDMPVYLLESEHFKIDGELLITFVRMGARGKLTFLHEGAPEVFAEEMAKLCEQTYLQKVAAGLAKQHQALYYETAPKLSVNQKEASIRLRELYVRRTLFAEDAKVVLDEVEKPQTRFDDVIGATDAKDELQFFVNFLKNPGKYATLGLKPPGGILLYGPPGTGKTLLARALAGESEVAFISAAASSFVTKYQGSGPEAIRELFKRARRYAPSIVFIDEIDAIGRSRNRSDVGHGEEMALNALLTEMDGFSVDPKHPVFVLAATNFGVEEGKSGPGCIDAALVRRFDRKILIELPNQTDRQRYLEKRLGKHKNSRVSEAMIRRLAGRSTGLSLANLESVMELASRMAARKNSPLSDDLLEEAFELYRHGEKKDWGYEYLERVARHESGHAYLCFLSGRTPSYLTIVARGNHGGYMEQADEEHSPLKTREELLARIRVSLGGRAAEIVYYGEEEGLSSGASGDLLGATRIARAMICAYGMDDSVGMVALSEEEATRGPMAEKINRRIAEIIRKEMEKTIRILSGGKPQMDRLVSRLLEKNKLTREEIENALKP